MSFDYSYMYEYIYEEDKNNSLIERFFYKEEVNILIYYILIIGNILRLFFILLKSGFSFNLSRLDFINLLLIWLTLIRRIPIFVNNYKYFYNKEMVWYAIYLLVILIFLSNKLFYLYLFYELSLIPITVIIIFNGLQPERIVARIYFIIYILVFSLPFLLFIVLYAKNNSFLLFFQEQNLKVTTFMRLVILFPFLVKIPVYGVHFWLPKAHVEANIRGSIVLAGVLLKLGSFGLIKILIILPIIQYKQYSFNHIYLVLRLISRLATMIIVDLKKIVAYSRVTHITFILVNIINNINIINFVVTITMLSHAWASIIIFYGVGVFYRFTKSRLLMDNFIFSNKKLLLMFFIGLLCNSSIPPFPSFFTEIISLLTLQIKSRILIFLFVLIGMTICYYNVYLFIILEHGSNNRKSYNVNLRQINIFKILIYVLIITTIIVLFLYQSSLTKILVCGTKDVIGKPFKPLSYKLKILY